ncbi:cyclic nucleotide-binding domain-containing protein [Trinickia violacea]|uniref:Cyclic nucleotide-binding domain-containing protein n=1 Tax=Trinickia violacea TaxID=2571746 RepID=A0A4P8IZP6_9BURK|nr:LuxR C-terminal-related transcriptional regulator [Trinickia violacea]QCP52774.1 cyclic nucleotide-binding domain-containing protein [Trinickia violacea]
MRILLIAPPGLFRDGLARVVAELAADAEVKCADYGESQSDVTSGVDLLVLDGDNVDEALVAFAAARQRKPDLPVVALLGVIARAGVEHFTGAGVNSCVDKSESAAELMNALRAALAGGIRLSPEWLSLAAGEAQPAAPPEVTPDASAPATRAVLTPRQIEVLALAARGESNKAIARRLKITEGTVKVHLYTVYKALNVNSRGQASVAAMRLDKVGDQQWHQALNGDLSVRRLFASMMPCRFKPGDVLFHKDDASDALYYLVRGRIRLQEIGIEVSPGTIVGEIGLFSADHRRTCTARCESDCELLSMSAMEAMRFYYQDPEFAAFLIQLITRRLVDDKSRSER